MTALQMNAEIFRQLSLIAEDDSKMKRALKALRRIAEPKPEPTLMSREEFFAKLKRGEDAYRRGECTRLLPGESVTDMLRRTGYVL